MEFRRPLTRPFIGEEGERKPLTRPSPRGEGVRSPRLPESGKELKNGVLNED